MDCPELSTSVSHPSFENDSLPSAIPVDCAETARLQLKQKDIMDLGMKPKWADWSDVLEHDPQLHDELYIAFIKPHRAQTSLVAVHHADAPDKLY